MKMLEDRIRKDGIVREGNVLKVDSFINHQMDIPLFREMAREWKRLFAGKPINKVLTIEASGIGIAAVVASELNVPVVFAKKSMSINLDYDNYKTQIQSFTHKKIYNVSDRKTCSSHSPANESKTMDCISMSTSFSIGKGKPSAIIRHN